MRSQLGRSRVVSRLRTRSVCVLAVLGVSVPACRRDYEVLGFEAGDPASDALTGVGGTFANGGSGGASTSDTSSGDAGGANAAVTSSTGSAGAQGTGEVTGVDSSTTGAGTSTTDAGGSAGGVDAAGPTTTASSATTTIDGAGGMGGVGAGGATSTASGATTSTGGTGSTGASSATTTSGGAGGTGSAGSGGTGSAGSDADIASGYWRLDAADSAGTDWTPSTLVVTSTAPNPDGTTDLTYRIDWFETSPGFGVLLGGEELGVGNYDPVTRSLTLTQTGGFASDSLDVYEAEFDAASDTLSGFWDTGSPGTFTGARQLDGTLLPAPAAVASSTQSGTSASNTVDADMFTEWSSSNGSTVGETLTLTLATPASLRGLRLMAVPGGSAGAPARLRVSSRDSGGNELDLSDVVVPSDPMWNAIPLVVDAAVVQVRLEITEVAPANANRVLINGVELFGTP